MLHAKVSPVEFVRIIEIVSCDCKRCSGSGWLSSCGRYLCFSGCCFWVEIFVVILCGGECWSFSSFPSIGLVVLWLSA